MSQLQPYIAPNAVGGGLYYHHLYPYYKYSDTITFYNEGPQPTGASDGTLPCPCPPAKIGETFSSKTRSQDHD